MSDTGPRPGTIDEAGLRSALARVQSRLGSRTMGATPPPRAAAPGSGLPRPMHPLVALDALALIWGLQPGGSAGTAQPVAGPGAIIAAGARLGLTVASESRSVLRIASADCPCLVMTGGGLSYLVLKVNDDGTLAIAVEGAMSTVAARDLAADAAGAIFRVRRASTTGATAGPPGLRLPMPVHVSPRPIIERVVAALKAQKRLVASLIASSVVINLLGLLLPMFSMTVFDRVIPHGAMETLWALAIGVVAALGLEMALRHARLRLNDAVAQSIGQGVQGELAARQLTARTSDLPQRSGGLVQPAAELDAIAAVTPSLVVGAAVDLPFFLLMMLLIASLAGPVVAAPLLGAVGLVAVHVLAHAMAARSSREQGSLQRRQQQQLIDMVAAQERIRLTGAAPAMLARYEQIVDDAGFASHQTRYWHGFAAQASAIIVQLVVAATLVIGVLQVNAAAMTIGALTACMLLVSRSMMPLSVVVGLGFRLRQLLEIAGPVARHLTAAPEAGGDERGVSAARIEGAIEFSGVSFTYPDEERPALQGISFAIRPGERVGLIGRSGCGKSTLLRLMARLHETGEGRIKLDGRDLRQYDPATLRRALGVMPQEASLADGTLQDNLVLGLPSVDDEVFETVVRMTGVHDIAARRPEGYSLQVGPGGQRLSAGERQCVSLARTLMGQPRLLLLDEPTSSFDNGHEQRLVAELKALPGAMGMVIATHRMALLALVDRVIWIDGGRVVADGPRDEVFKRHGLAA